MHQQYAKDGFVALSVSLDDPNEKGKPEKVLEFLKAKNATFTNLLLNEKDEVWQQKLKIDGPPCVFVFNREGHWVKKFADEKGYGVKFSEVEEVVVKLLHQK